MDLQAVLLYRKTKASNLYYKTKLQVHNFTLFDLISKEGYCYLWNESEGDLSSEVYAHLQYNYFVRIIIDNPNIENIVVWSDGCGYQNRNANVDNAFSQLSRQYRVVITQKYIVAGHTQMECDIMHSIKRRMLTDIFTPRDYIIIIQIAHLRPSPYQVNIQLSMICGHFSSEVMVQFTTSFPLQQTSIGNNCRTDSIHQMCHLDESDCFQVYF